MNLVISPFAGLFYVSALALLVVAGLGSLLYRQEVRDAVQDLDPDQAHLKKLMAVETPPGYVQNHLTAITPLKPGWLRRLTLAAAFLGINKLVKHRFRPGFILDIGTIHFARWFRLPKTGKLVAHTLVQETSVGLLVQASSPDQGAGGDATKERISSLQKDGSVLEKFMHNLMLTLGAWPI